MIALEQRFPFPLEEDSYFFSNNLKPLQPPCCIQLTTEYFHEVAEKRRLLAAHPERCFHTLPGTLVAQWEVVDTVVHRLVDNYPDCFTLRSGGMYGRFGICYWTRPTGSRLAMRAHFRCNRSTGWVDMCRKICCLWSSAMMTSISKPGNCAFRALGHSRLISEWRFIRSIVRCRGITNWPKDPPISAAR